MTEAEYRISAIEIIGRKSSRRNKELKKDVKATLGLIRVVSDDQRRNNLRLIGVPEEEENNPKEMKTIMNIIAKAFSDLEDANIQIQVAEKVPAKRSH